jgi:hypothetical protein
MLSAQQQFRTALRGALLNAYKLSRDQGRKEIVIQGKWTQRDCHSRQIQADIVFARNKTRQCFRHDCYQGISVALMIILLDC